MTALNDSVPVRRALYDVGTLLGGWVPDDVLSYARTLDAQVYEAAVRAGLRVPRDESVAVARTLHDHAMTWDLSARVSQRRVVAFMGGHKLSRGSGPYALTAEIARQLAAEDDCVIVSGGGPGAMEAAHLGARLSGRPESELRAALELIAADPATSSFPDLRGRPLVTAAGFDREVLAAIHRWQQPAFAVADRWPVDTALASIGVPTWLYGHEPPTPLATFHAKYFENSLREDGLLAIGTWGVVFAEGAAGTLQEIFQDAAQNYYASVDGLRSRMVFLDIDEYWSVRRPVKLLLDGLFDDATEAMMHFVVTAEDAVQALRLGPVHA